MATVAAMPRLPASPRLFTAIATHGVVDFFSFIVIPLLSVIEGRVQLTPWQGTTLVAVGSVASGLIQPIVALLSDRHDTRYFGTIGFAAAVLAIGSIGYANNFLALLLIQIVGAAGIGAFHPVAAAAVGQLSGAARSTGLAWFYAAGMIGGVVGNLTAPMWVRHFALAAAGPGASEVTTDVAAGLRSLVYLIPAGLVCAGALAVAIHSIAHRHGGAQASHAALPRIERIARWRAVWLLYFGNVLRFTVDMCLITLLVRWSELMTLGVANGEPLQAVTAGLTPELRSQASQLNGAMQAARQAGMGAGGLAIAMLLGRRFERGLLIGLPLVGAAVIFVTPMCERGGIWVIYGLCVIAGLGYGGVVPTTLSLAQRLLPHRTSLASGLMLGGAWMFASVGPHLAQALLAWIGLRGAFAVVAILLVASAVMGWMIPRSLIARH